MNYFLLFIAAVNLYTTIIALRKCKNKDTILARPYKTCEPFGSFVWADHVIFGPFWIIASLLTYFLNDGLLFLLLVAIFWLVRSAGETLYWFFQQFSPRVGNEPAKFWINRYVPGDAVWFMHQIFWQCITVVSLVATIYLGFQWLSRSFTN